MSNLQHIKGSRTRVLNTFPTKTFGNDGDIVISRINGKGVFLCSKAGGMWYAANKMQELNKLEKTSIRELTTNKLTINKMINTERSADRFVVNDGGSIKYRTGEQVVGDLPLPFDNIAYKTAYCSLGQYSDKGSCESNGGTWYYSNNDSHDSISSTAENQLLTVGQSISGVDAEPTLTYDGSILEIKYNSDYDDNWQTSATTNLLKLTYDSEKYATMGVESTGVLEINASRQIILDAPGGGVKIKDDGDSHFEFDCNNTRMFIFDDTDSSDYFLTTVDANGATTLKTNDNDGIVGHLTLDVDGDLILDPTSGLTKFYRAGDTDDLCTLQVSADGATTIATSDSDGSAGNLTLAPNGTLKLTPSNGIMNFYDSDNSADYADIRVGSNGELLISTIDAAAAAAYIKLTADGFIALEPSAGSYVRIDGSAGFTQATTTYSDDSITSSGGTNDTDVDFRTTNKRYLGPSAGTIVNLNLIFPVVSGNFLLYTRSAGSWAVTNWISYEYDVTVASGFSGEVVWPGGTEPTLTAEGYDIFSFYWDAGTQRCFGQAGLNFT